MISLFKYLLMLLFLQQIEFSVTQALASEPAQKPPLASVANQIDEYFGKQIVDPYRWMEKGISDKPFHEYLRQQNEFTQYNLNSIGVARHRLLARIRELDSAVPIVRTWQRAGDRIFYLETTTQPMSTFLMVRDAQGHSRKLLDPRVLARAGKHSSIDYYLASFDGKFLAVGISLGGSENSTIHVIDVDTGKLLPEKITRAQYAYPSWLKDSSGFYYSRLQELEENSPPSAVYENEKVYLHKIGKPITNDQPVVGYGLYADMDIPKAGFVGVSTDPLSPYLIAYHSAGTSDPQTLYLGDDRASGTNAGWKKIIDKTDKLATQVASNFAIHDSVLYALLEKDAPNGEIVAINLADPETKVQTKILPQSDRILRGVFAAADALYITSRKGMQFYLQRIPYSAPQKIEDIALPYEGTISGIDASPLVPGIMFRLESWIVSGQAFRYDPETQTIINTGLVEKHTADFSAMEVREKMAPSSGNVSVPISIVCPKSTPMSGLNRVIEVGYGAYGISVDPAFDPTLLAWLERGGIVAIVHPRGGGELGQSWHEAGRKQNKQHTIDDMIAAAEYLIQQKYTSPKFLAIKGTSAGGIACGGAMAQRPDLFAAVIDNVGLTDMVNFQSTQGGAANIPEFGDLNKPDEFGHLFAMSAYHHIKDRVAYPAFLGETGVNDPRVPPWMIAKMTARVQAASSSGKPVLLRVDFDAGHGNGSNRRQRQEQLTDERSFVLWQTGDPEFQPSFKEDPFD